MRNLSQKMTALVVAILLLHCSYVMAQHNYGEVLQKSLFFYEAQQSGFLPDWNRVSWRADATTTDGADVGLDLNGGWYDAGDHVKFNFPMSYSVTILCWGAIEYEDAYRDAGQLDILKRNIRYVTDYLLKCHTAPNEFYGQVGHGGRDHAWWGSPEVYLPDRPSYKIDTAHPGSDLAAEAAAALSAASILFANDDPAYSALLVQHAEELYSFADNYRGEYSNSITDAAGYYRSFSSYQDEIVWGAIWLYRATNDNQYLMKAEAEYDNMQREGQGTIAKYKEALSWDDKAYGAYVLLAQLTGKNKYKTDAERNLDYFAGGGSEQVPTTPGGLPHIRQWGTLRYANNEALLCLIYSDKVSTDPAQQQRYTTFAKFIADYSLGTNPINRSFVVGYGNNPAYNPHHRGNHGNWTNNVNGEPVLPSHTLYGALVGGPKNPNNDEFADDRNEHVANEVACDYNAGFTGVMARMYSEYGGTPLTNFPQPEVPTRAEVRTFSKFNSNNASGSTVRILVQNRTAWPARVTDKLSFRYFFDISEGVAQGYTISDYTPQLNSVQGSSTLTVGTWDATNNIYYAEVSLVGEAIAPVGDPAFRREVQLNFRVSNGVPYDVANDWSANGLGGGTEVESTNIPVYDDGVLVFGNEPNGGDTPSASFTATPISGKEPLVVTFDATNSSDPNGDPLTYSWVFGDGATGSGATVTHTYTNIGDNVVVLTVSDGANSDTATETIEVLDSNDAPIAAIAVDNVSGVAPATFNFDGTGSSDPNGDPLTYLWDFGDGSTSTLASPSHVYNLEGNYTVTLIVNDGSRDSDPVVQILSVTDGSLIVSFTATPDTGTIPLTVSFDASESSDPEGGTLSYSWDFGNGLSGTGVNSTSTYATAGSYTVTLTATSGVKTGTATQVITANEVSNCGFDTPSSTGLPTFSNVSFSHAHVLGNGGPDLSNLNNFTINWDVPNNGLYQFSILTTNGVPNWWNNLIPTATQNFNSPQPALTLAGTGFTGLDGDYWVTEDAGNFVMVSKTGGFTIYFSNNPVAPDCGNSPATLSTDLVTTLSGTAPLSINSSGAVLPSNSVNNTGAANNIYVDRFLEMRDEIYDPANGYFSADGSPHHSVESLIVEAPDHGHESTSELYSYWLWLEVMYGRVTEDWQPVSDVWDAMERMIIPTNADQPTNAAYNPSSPAAYAAEFPLPSNYPSPLLFNAPVGVDPVSADLTAEYGDDVYLMHWLLDNDNFYGYGNRGDGVSTPSYINTFQRGEQESVFETIPHPSWESFDWGGDDGYLPLFVEDPNYAKQWRYTSAPDADARAVQAMYWAYEYIQEQGLDPATLPLDKATKMGDYLRLSMFDKYFKPLGVQSATSGAGQGYESAHYLMSWYTSWGGSADPASAWAFRISSSHCHFGYQNPIAAYALTQVNALKPQSQNGVRDWTESLNRQLEFYTWLQAPNGAIAGGATNSWNGDYSTYPVGKATFYDMAYDTDPVYHDPGSGTWFGWQAWSMERIAEYYYITNDPMAKSLMDKWSSWVISEVQLIGTDDFNIPATLSWSGEPDTWDPLNPGTNAGLSVTVTDYGKDLGIAASMAKALTYYAAATEKYGTLNTAARDLAQEVLDRMWTTYRDDKGVSAPESRGDFSRIFDQEVYVPSGYEGYMPNGDTIKSGIKFLDIRSGLKNDPDFAALETAYNSGVEYTQNYHRTWAQIEVALANAEFGYFFGPKSTINVAITAPVNGAKLVEGSNVTITADATDSAGSITQVEFFVDGVSLGVDTTSPYSMVWSSVVQGAYSLTAVATNNSSDTRTSSAIDVTVGNTAPVANLVTDVTGGSVPLTVNFDASASTDADGDVLSYSWSFGDGTTGAGALVSHDYTVAGSYMVTLTVSDGNGGSDMVSVMIEASNLPDCSFGAPLAAGLPSMVSGYNNIHVLGTGGPSLSNVTAFNINWDNTNNGLYQFSMSTNNGQPSWWVNLIGASTHTLKSASPSITISGSGIAGLDGAYYATTDGGNFALVSQTGGFTIYFSNSSTEPSCAPSNARTASTDSNAFKGKLEVMLFPNPASQHLSISSNHGLRGATVRIYDVNSNQRVSVSIENSINTASIDISALSFGIYIVELTTASGEKQHFKLMKQ
ncbi:glycoside hydrolase family 48 protein [Reichenbachiella versicolor]|uniref:glycoside hydrolase family 48 protein n=1 Tax=Reichenbachiella versicolor TaxID=1821036 RepID=UPI000D6E8FE4|nr:glycoside hydrolase family 48 protein [Reichenbachiella versicolor]